MKTKNDELYDTALNAVQAFASDTSVAAEVTRDRLDELRAEIGMSIEAIESDLQG